MRTNYYSDESALLDALELGLPEEEKAFKLSFVLPYRRKIKKINPTKEQLVLLLRKAETNTSNLVDSKVLSNMLSAVRKVGRDLQSSRESGGVAIFVDEFSAKVVELHHTPNPEVRFGREFYLAALQKVSDAQ